MKSKLESNNGVKNRRLKVQRIKKQARTNKLKTRREENSKTKIVGKVASNKITGKVENKETNIPMDINKLKAKNFDCYNENKLYLNEDQRYYFINCWM